MFVKARYFKKHSASRVKILARHSETAKFSVAAERLEQ